MSEELYRSQDDYTYGYMVFPRVIWEQIREGSLEFHEGALLALVHNLSNQEHGCLASNNWLVDHLPNCSIRKLQKSITKLRDMGFLRVEHNRNDTGRLVRELHIQTPKPPTQNGVSNHVQEQHGSPQPTGANHVQRDTPLYSPPKGGKYIYNKYAQPSVGLGDGLLDQVLGRTSTTSPFFDKCAKKLYHSLPHRTKAARKFKPSTWAIHFQRLHQVDGIPKKLIKKVLLWYCQNRNEKYVPVCTTAETFRKKFDNLVVAMERANRETPLPDKASAAAKKIANGFQDTPFDDQMPMLVQQAMDCYDALLEKYPGFQDVFDQVFHNRTSFVRGWFSHWFDKYGQWKDWSRQPSTVQCVLDSPKFRQYVDDKVRAYSSRKLPWNANA